MFHRAYFLILIVILKINSIFASSMLDKCFGKGSQYSKKAFYGTESCYFMVPNATEEANTKTSDNMFIFSLQKAREICSKHDARLPKVTNDGKHDFLKAFASDYKFVALSLEFAQNQLRVWDDEQPFRYEPEKLIQDTDGHFDRYHAIILPQSAVREWRFVPQGKRISDPIQVICEQPASHAEHPVDKCFPPKNSTYQKTEIMKRGRFSSNYFCLFVIKDATKTANHIGLVDKSKFIFDIEFARSECRKEGGYLPVIRSLYDQENLIEFHRSAFGDMPRIALGLEIDPDSQIYVWDDRIDIKHIRPEINIIESKNKTVLRNVYLLTHENRTWMEEANYEETFDQSSLICQQAHEIALIYVRDPIYSLIFEERELAAREAAEQENKGHIEKIELSILLIGLMIFQICMTFFK